MTHSVSALVARAFENMTREVLRVVQAHQRANVFMLVFQMATLKNPSVVERSEIR